VVNIEEGVGLEFLREHTDVLEVYDPDFVVRVEEEVLLLDVGVVDATTPLERGQELLLNRGGQPRTRSAALRRLWERNGSITSRENGQLRDSNLEDVFNEFVGAGEGSRRPMVLEKPVPDRSRPLG